ncbi:MAG TPA: hypothetical protein VGL71_10535 [Urbifossiella sp.]|jgi:hypothetical protein
MPRFRAWGLAAAVAVGWGTSAVGADDPSRPPSTVFKKLFGPSKPKDGPVARASTPRSPATVVMPLPPEVVAAALDAEQKAWERRISVCDKLRQIAYETNDESLLRQVDDLERQAASLYSARAAALGVPRVKSEATETADRKPSEPLKVTAKKLTAPAAPAAIDPAVRTADARTPTDVIREVQP